MKKYVYINMRDGTSWKISVNKLIEYHAKFHLNLFNSLENSIKNAIKRFNDDEKTFENWCKEYISWNDISEYAELINFSNYEEDWQNNIWHII